MPRLFRKSQRYNVAKNSWVSKIVLLDNTSIEINLQPDVTGADCLERVAQCMDIFEVRGREKLKILVVISFSCMFNNSLIY